MSVTTEPPAASPPEPSVEVTLPLTRAQGAEGQGEVSGSGYKSGAALVRRADGQMVQVGSLMYALFECLDGERDAEALAAAMSERVGKPVQPDHVQALARKLADQGLLAGTEAKAPPKSNPLLALRWKVIVTNPRLTKRMSTPFAQLYRPWMLIPILAAFAATLWFVLVDKGVASATSQAFQRPGLLLLIFGLSVLSAGFHELGHASACRYGGATPGGMGAGIYLVFPAFYTDVTDAYRLPRRGRLRVDLGGLYFNAIVAVTTMGVWLATGEDALLLLVALEVVAMVKQLSPVIRADGYHILADLTGVPDLFAHIGPTLRRLLPWRTREPSALTGRARVVVTLWVLVVVPVLASMALGAVVMLPRLASTAWESASRVAGEIPAQASDLQIFQLVTSCFELLAVALPVLGSVLLTQRLVRMAVGGARRWSGGDTRRRSFLSVPAVAVAGVLLWAWWPSGQYEPVTGAEDWTLAGLARDTVSPRTPAPPVADRRASGGDDAGGAPVRLKPGTHLAATMVPRGGASKKHPALLIIRGDDGQPPVVLIDENIPPPAAAQSAPASGTASPAAQPGTATGKPGAPAATVPSASASAPRGSPAGGAAPGPGTSAGAGGSPASAPVSNAVVFPFVLPKAPREGDTQALATGKKDGGVTYDIAYSLVTVKDGENVDERNGAYALASCKACTTVAVSFQVVLVVGESRDIRPVNVAEALNVNCPACVTTAVADQIVVTLRKQPSQEVTEKLTAALKKLDALESLGKNGTPKAIAAEVQAVQAEVNRVLDESGLRTSDARKQEKTKGTEPEEVGGQTTTETQTTTAPTSGTAGTSTSTAPRPSSTSTAAPQTTTAPPTQTTPTPTQTAPAPTGTTGG